MSVQPTAAPTPQPPEAPVVALAGVSKAYGPIQALSDVALQLHGGEVHCLAGENGAGKSTLIKILTGAVRRDSGEYRIHGRDMGNPTPAQARDAGIGVVYQELSLLPDLSVGENLLMGRLPARRGITRPGELGQRARTMLERVDLDWLDPDTPVEELSLAVRQLVEIAKVLGQSPQVLIFDEPTTALSESETAALLARIRQLRDEGHAVMYVTHHLEEMFEIGDRVTVLRDGRVATTAPMREFDHDSLIASMVGRKIEQLYAHGRRTIGEPRDRGRRHARAPRRPRPGGPGRARAVDRGPQATRAAAGADDPRERLDRPHQGDLAPVGGRPRA
jgi:ABC-type sugar transport system ATPase subunit